MFKACTANGSDPRLFVGRHRQSSAGFPGTLPEVFSTVAMTTSLGGQRSLSTHWRT